MSRLDKEEEPKSLEQLLTSLRQLLHMFEGVIQEGSITQQTYFAFLSYQVPGRSQSAVS